MPQNFTLRQQRRGREPQNAKAGGRRQGKEGDTKERAKDRVGR